MASRTDRGVSARANALVLTSALRGESVLGALNGVAPDIWASRATPVPVEFEVRRATARWYRYFEAPSPYPLAAWQRAAARFSGPVDVRSFARGVPGGTPTVRPVDAVVVAAERGGLRIDVRAPSFVWGMVRKIVAALRAHASGALGLDELDAAIAGRRRLALPLAEPERLVLWEVRHPVRWEHRRPARPGAPGRRLRAEAERAAIRARVLRALAGPGAQRPAGRTGRP